MSYAVKEIFYTLQGEGALTGRPAVFCRFAGCNLWSGREADRAAAICAFCDTDFVGTDGTHGGQYRDAATLADRVAALWPPGEQENGPARFVVCTGGEPLLQLDPPLIEALHRRGFAVAIETNGTIAVPPGLDWVCVSPKAGAPIVVTAGDELKIIVPQRGSIRSPLPGSISGAFRCSRWTEPNAPATPSGRSRSASSTRAGSSACRPTR